MKIIIFICLLISFSHCQFNGKFWWTDNRVRRFNKVNIPEPIIEDISPFETDESAKIVFRDSDTTLPKPINNNSKKKVDRKLNTDICHYVKKEECNGIIYTTEFGKSVNKGPSDPQLICCLEAPPTEPTKEDTRIYFPDYFNNHKRSNRLKRSIKIKQKSSRKEQDSQKDYEEDPYWNIKNSNFHNAQTHEKEEIAEDYAEELPRPGLINVYADSGRRPGWSFVEKEPLPSSYGGIVYEEVDDTPTFGYGSIDPRRDFKSTKRLRIPPKQQTTFKDTPYVAENQIISFQSNPDFKVLQGFKLLNLVKVQKINDEDKHKDDQSKEMLFSKPLPVSSFSSEENLSDENDEIFHDCGKSTRIREKDQHIGEAIIGSHPWLTLVVDSSKRNTILCYATLIHPRAAITAAKCVNNKTSPRDLTIIAGLQFLNRNSNTSRRSPKIILHPNYKTGDLESSLALLIWRVPLKLGINIQPACLTSPTDGQDCMLFGWGGFGSGIRSRSWWQRGEIRTCNNRTTYKAETLPPNAFCVSVEPQNPFVTGLGGPLICKVNGRDAMAGVLITRQYSFVMIPVQDWAMQASQAIHEQD